MNVVKSSQKKCGTGSVPVMRKKQERPNEFVRKSLANSPIKSVHNIQKAKADRPKPTGRRPLAPILINGCPVDNELR